MKVGGQIFNGMLHLSSKRVQLSDGKTPYERRLGQPFKGTIIPFGSLVEYHPITAEEPVKKSINFERKSYLDCSSDTQCTRGEFLRVTY